MSEPGASLVDRVAALRGEVLVGVEGGDREPPGSEVFEAALRALSLRERARQRPGRPPDGGASRRAGEVDLALHDAIARRLAWRDSELRVLADAREVCRRLLASARRSLRDPADQIEVAAAVAEAGSAAARILVTLVLGRVGRERAAMVREELAQDRLTQALARQREEVARLEEALAAWRPPAGRETEG